MGGISGLGDELAEDALPNEIKQTMRKMSKKDSTTKLKVSLLVFQHNEFDFDIKIILDPHS